MRVLMTADAVGGVWTYALDLTSGLRRRGDDVTLAVLGPALSREHRDAAGAIAGVKLIETGLPLDWTAETPDQLAGAAQALAKAAIDARAQVVHLSSPALAASARFAAPVVGVAHSCLQTWWDAVRGGEPPREFAWRIAATAAGYRACDTVIAPSAAFAAATEAAFGVAPIVVRNGRSPPTQSFRAVRDVPVITAGRLWDEGKDAATLDLAAARLGAPVFACGPTRGLKGETAAFANLDLRGCLPAEELQALMARTRVFASAALYEPFGLAVLEAAQAGCALVLSDIPTFRELWSGAAVFVPPRDAQGFAAAISNLLDDQSRADGLSAAARVRAERYDLDRFVEGTAAVHRAVADARRPSPILAGAAA